MKKKVHSSIHAPVLQVCEGHALGRGVYPVCVEACVCDDSPSPLYRNTQKWNSLNAMDPLPPSRRSDMSL